VISPNLKERLTKLVKDRLVILSVIFFFVHVLGLLWTEDIEWGLIIVRKMAKFLIFLPILFSVIRLKDFSFYILIFLISMFIVEVVSYLVYFEIIDKFLKARIDNPTPTMSHISFNPFLAISIYICLHEILFNKLISKERIIFYSLLAIMMSITMFITEGRAGHIAFFIVFGLLFIQYFGFKKIRSYLALTILIPLIFYGAYELSPNFNKRVNETIKNASLFYSGELKNTSIGQRIVFSLNSLDLIKDNVMLGVGTGDYPREYLAINKINSPNIPPTVNPHNMYLLVTAQTGILGLLSLISIFIYQINYAIKKSDERYKNIALALPIIYLVIMFSDSYLLGHFTTVLFIFLSSLIYRQN